MCVYVLIQACHLGSWYWQGWKLDASGGRVTSQSLGLTIGWDERCSQSAYFSPRTIHVA